MEEAAGGALDDVNGDALDEGEVREARREEARFMMEMPVFE